MDFIMKQPGRQYYVWERRSDCGIGFRSCLPSHWSLVIGHWSLVIGHWSLVIGHWSLVTGHSPLVTRHWSLVIAHCPLPTAHCPLSTAPPPAARRLQPDSCSRQGGFTMLADTAHRVSSNTRPE